MSESDAASEAADEVRSEAREAKSRAKGLASNVGGLLKTGVGAIGNFLFGTRTRGLVTATAVGGLAVGAYAHKRGEAPWQKEHGEEELGGMSAMLDNG